MLLQKKRKENNPDWPQIPDHSFRILIIGCSGSGKSSFNLINQQSDIDKIYLYAKNPYAGLKHFNDSKAFIEYSNDMDDIYKNIEEYNPNKKCKILIIFNDMIADLIQQ